MSNPARVRVRLGPIHEPHRAAGRTALVALLTSAAALVGLAFPAAAATATPTVVVGASLTAVDDSASVVKNGSVWLNVLDNDIAPNADPVWISNWTSPAHGVADLNGETGMVEYFPAYDFSGTDTFDYLIQSSGYSSWATVTVTVQPSTNNRPLGVIDLVTVPSGATTDLAVIANDTDPDNDALSLYEISTPPSHGTAVIKDAAAGIASYQPTPGFSGHDVFYYYVQDVNGAVFGQVAVEITVESATFSGTNPVITGTPAVGQTLTAEPGDYTPSDGVTLSYQWIRNGVYIDGATASTYTATAADGGTYLSATVTAVRGGETVILNSNSVTVPVVNEVPPSITGTATVGHTLLTSPGTWLSAPGLTFGYQWLRDGTPISGATLSSYLLSQADAGHLIAARVLGQNAPLDDVVASSAPRAVAALNLTRPSFRGVLRAGRLLTASKGLWAAPGHVYRYQWLRNGKVINHATAYRYRLTHHDRGKRIRVRVTAVRTGFPAVHAVSASKRIHT
jgi:hypothetical protein